MFICEKFNRGVIHLEDRILPAYNPLVKEAYPPHAVTIVRKALIEVKLTMENIKLEQILEDSMPIYIFDQK
jgi:hypothetical protein